MSGVTGRIRCSQMLDLLGKLQVLYIKIMIKVMLWLKPEKRLQFPFSQPTAETRRPLVEPRTAPNMRSY